MSDRLVQASGKTIPKTADEKRREEEAFLSLNRLMFMGMLDGISEKEPRSNNPAYLSAYASAYEFPTYSDV